MDKDPGVKVVDKRKNWEARVEMAVYKKPKAELGPYEKLIYSILCGHANRGGDATVYVKTIADEASCCDRQVRRALSNLEARGLVARKAQYRPDGQTLNIYEVYGMDNYTPPDCQSGGGMTVSPGGYDCQSGLYNDEQPLLNNNKTFPPSPQRGSEENGPFELENEPRTPADDEELRHEAIVGEYNRVLPELSQAKTVSSFRRKALRRCVRQDAARKEIDWWRRYFERVRECPWLLGQNPSGWRANLDWLLRDEPMQKVIEGAYIGHGERGGRTAGGEAAQKNFTNDGGEVDARALLRNIGTGRN